LRRTGTDRRPRRSLRSGWTRDASARRSWRSPTGGHALAQVIRRNLAKSRDGAARAIETTNAHAPGDETVAEASYLAYLCLLEGRGKAQGIIVYDSREAPGHVDLANRAEPMAGLACAYGDTSGVDLERIARKVCDPNTPPEEARRF
jgi:hypothetical protein